MIKPFKILDEKPHPLGTAVTYLVGVREGTDSDVTERSVEGYILVPKGADVTKTTYDYLKQCGWIR